MKNITISDIAKKASVSIGTVSNVLNNKGNVKIETIRLVEQAAESLGYVPNKEALSIKKKQSNLIILLINQLTDCVSTFIIDFMRMAENYDFDYKIIETSKFESEEILLLHLKQQKYLKIICLPSANFAGLATLNHQKNIIYISGDKQSLPEHAKRLSIVMDNVLNELVGQDYFVIGDRNTTNLLSIIETETKEFRLLSESEDNLDFIYSQVLAKKPKQFLVFSHEIAAKLLIFVEAHQIKLKDLIIISTSKNCHSYHQPFVKCFYYSSNEIALNIFYSLAKKSTTINPVSIYPTDWKQFDIKDTSVSPLKILMLDSPFSKSLNDVLPIFNQQTGLTAEITTATFDELNDRVHSENLSDFDLIRLDVSYFNWYGDRIFKNLTHISEIKTIAQSLTGWEKYKYLDGQLYALPADPSVQLMLYRSDVFNNQVIQKTFLNKTSRTLKAPKTLSDLAKFATFYSELDIPEKKAAFPIAITKETSALVASEFLPYYFSLEGDILYDGKVFKLHSEPFMKALTDYQTIVNCAKHNNEPWWDGEINAFNHSETALIIGYSNQLSQIKDVNYDFSTLPGNTPAYGGGVFGITKSSNNVSTATFFLEWFYQYQTQELLSNFGIFSSLKHLNNEQTIQKKFPFFPFSTHLFETSERVHSSNTAFIFNTILIEKIIGREIRLGIDNHLSNLDIFQNVLTVLNTRQKELVRETIKQE